MNDGLREQLRRVAVDLGPELSSVVFTGGAVVGVYLDESYGSEVRYTRDVDVVHAAATRMDYYSLEARLRERGWAQSMGDDDPICRWITPSQVVVDVMAVDPDALGFANRWYRAGFDSAISIDLGAGLKVAAFEPAVFLATKIEAYADRGKGDWFASHDIEDVIAVIEGRSAIVDEVVGASNAVRAFVCDWARSLAAHPSFTDIVEGHMSREGLRSGRLPKLLDQLRRMARIS